MQSLPKTVTYFEAMKNNFSGTLNLERLPSSIVSLYLNSSKFSGTVDLSKVLPSIVHLSFDNTNITQKVVVIRVPVKGVRLLRFSNGQFDEIQSVYRTDLTDDVTLIV